MKISNIYFFTIQIIIIISLYFLSINKIDIPFYLYMWWIFLIPPVLLEHYFPNNKITIWFFDKKI
jgi:hypothetical protein